MSTKQHLQIFDSPHLGRKRTYFGGSRQVCQIGRLLSSEFDFSQFERKPDSANRKIVFLSAQTISSDHAQHPSLRFECNQLGCISSLAEHSTNRFLQKSRFDYKLARQTFYISISNLLTIKLVNQFLGNFSLQNYVFNSIKFQDFLSSTFANILSHFRWVF